MNKIFLLIISIFVSILFVSSANAANWYVSKIATGTNAGTSWANAWNELNQINWNIVQPGDTIYLDGGAVACDYPTYVTENSNTPKSTSGGDCGMVYTTNLVVGKSGTSSNPINILLSTESGRSGTVRIFGGYSDPLPYCGQSTGTFTPRTQHYNRGIVLDGRSYVNIDGSHWSGILVYGFDTIGIYAGHAQYQTQHDLKISNVEVFDNGFTLTVNEYDYTCVTKVDQNAPDGQGIYFTGNNFVFNRVIVHDNGQDAFQTCYIGDFNNVLINNSWLFNQRAHPLHPQEVFNFCMHTDGLQMCSDTSSNNVRTENSIVGPGFMQSFIIGGGGNRNSTSHFYQFVNDLMIHHHGLCSNAGIWAGQGATASDLPNDYTIDRVTLVRDIDNTWWSFDILGRNHRLLNTLVYGGMNIDMGANRIVSNFYWYGLNNPGYGIQANPNFVDNNFTGVGDGFADFDFTITNPSIPSNVGSSIHRVRDLIGKDPQSSGGAVTYHPVDTNQDGCVSLGEISAYVGRWLNGQITLGAVSGGVSEWLGGC